MRNGLTRSLSKVLALMLAVCMCMVFMPTTAYAASGDMNTGHSVSVRFVVLYVGSEFNIGYSYGSSESTTFVCQYSVNHSASAYNNHTIAISDIRAAANRLSINSGYKVTGWGKTASKNPTVWSLNLSGTTACNKGDTIYIVAKKPDPVTANYKVQWYDADTGEKLKTDATRSGNVGETVSATSSDKKITDYTYNASLSTESATLATSGTVLKLYFNKNKPKTADYLVQWYDADTGEKLKADETRNGTVGNKVSATENDKKVTDYTYNASLSTESATLATSGTVLKLYFNKNKPKETTYKVEWYDENGELIKDAERTAKVDEEVAVTEDDKKLKGYKFDADNENNNLSDIAAEDGSTVLKLYFVKDGEGPDDPDPDDKETTYKVEWYDENGELIKDAERTAKVDEEVAVTEDDKKLKGYKFDADNENNNLSDIAAEDGSTVLKLYFVKDGEGPDDPDPDDKTTTYKVRWYDSGTGEMIKEATRTAEVGEEVEVTEDDKNLPGYTFDADNENNLLSDIAEEDGGTVLKLYFSKNGDKPDKPDKPDPDKPDKPDPDKPDKPDKPDPDKPNKPDKPNRPDRDNDDDRDPSPTPKPKPTGDNYVNPKTGETRNVAALALAACSVLMMAAVVAKKKHGDK